MSAVALELAKQALDFVASSIELSGIPPGFAALRFVRNDRLEAELEDQLSGFVALMGTIHDGRNADRSIVPVLEQFATFDGIVDLSG